jgi:methylated-DNA-[protein]-cysteine S-methyltransferase
MHSYAIFDTALGRCAIVWGPRGIAAVELPGSRRALRGASEAPPPPEVAGAIEAIVALLDGDRRDLNAIAVDMDGVGEFERRVYDAARAVPAGETVTYGEIAARIGERGAAQAVGRALGRNPFPIVVPCHRVVAADGSLRGFSAPGGIETKRRMLAIEGAGAPTLFA